MPDTGIVFPHQLFEHSEIIDHCQTIFLIEEWLFFRQYRFHKKKIAFHRASMKFYQSYLERLNKKVIYIDSFNELSDIRQLIAHIPSLNSREMA